MSDAELLDYVKTAFLAATGTGKPVERTFLAQKARGEALEALDPRPHAGRGLCRRPQDQRQGRPRLRLRAGIRGGGDRVLDEAAGSSGSERNQPGVPRFLQLQFDKQKGETMKRTMTALMFSTFMAVLFSCGNDKGAGRRRPGRPPGKGALPPRAQLYDCTYFTMTVAGGWEAGPLTLGMGQCSCPRER